MDNTRKENITKIITVIIGAFIFHQENIDYMK